MRAIIYKPLLFVLSIISSLNIGINLLAQNGEDDPKIFDLSPFTVSENESVGYAATSTLAGTRIKTDLKDLGAAISVVTEEFMEDVGATDALSLLSYTANTEVGAGRMALARRTSSNRGGLRTINAHKTANACVRNLELK